MADVTEVSLSAAGSSAQLLTGLDGANVCFGSKAEMAVRLTNVRFTPESGHSRNESAFPTGSRCHEVNPLHIRRLWDPVAGSCHSAPAQANKSWSRYRRPKTERSCIEAYPGKGARTRQTKLLIPTRRTQPSYDRGCQRLLGIF